MSHKKNKGFSTRSLIKRFDFKILYKGNLNKKIIFPGLHRTGIELSSKYKIFERIDSAVLWSGNESKFLNQLSKANQFRAIENVLKLNPPIILLGNGFKHQPQLMKLAKEYSTTIVDTNLSSSQAIILVGT
jgi:serine kinase of HPr protein (carbohydrate metabolism regulator)